MSQYQCIDETEKDREEFSELCKKDSAESDPYKFRQDGLRHRADGEVE